MNQGRSNHQFRTGLQMAGHIALFLAIYLVLDHLVNAILDRFSSLRVTQPVSPSIGLIREAAALATVLAATWAMARIEKRPHQAYGYSSQRGVHLFATGIACGLLALSGLIGCMILAGSIRFIGINDSVVTVLAHAIEWALVFLMIGILEESIFRGYLQHVLTRGIGFWWAAALVSAAFMIWHLQNGGETVLGLLATALGSFVFCLSLWYTKSLWWGIGFHTGWDWSQSFLYGTPDSGVVVKGAFLSSQAVGPAYLSGGTAGPEGSALLIPCFVILAILMWLHWGARSPLRATNSISIS